MAIPLDELANRLTESGWKGMDDAVVALGPEEGYVELRPIVEANEKQSLKSVSGAVMDVARRIGWHPAAVEFDDQIIIMHRSR